MSKHCSLRTLLSEISPKICKQFRNVTHSVFSSPKEKKNCAYLYLGFLKLNRIVIQITAVNFAKLFTNGKSRSEKNSHLKIYFFPPTCVIYCYKHCTQIFF